MNIVKFAAISDVILSNNAVSLSLSMCEGYFYDPLFAKLFLIKTWKLFLSL